MGLHALRAALALVRVSRLRQSMEIGRAGRQGRRQRAYVRGGGGGRPASVQRDRTRRHQRYKCGRQLMLSGVHKRRHPLLMGRGARGEVAPGGDSSRVAAAGRDCDHSSP